jgi:hypothetical protein
MVERMEREEGSGERRGEGREGRVERVTIR